MLESITDEIATSDYPGEQPFMLWRGQQMAIGELMTEKDGDEWHCIGYSAFVKKYHTDEDFHRWFIPIEKSLQSLVVAREQSDWVAGYRLRRVQHRLMDLITLLDPDGTGEGRDRRDKVYAAEKCKCIQCPAKPVPKSAAVNINKQKSEVNSDEMASSIV